MRLLQVAIPVGKRRAVLDLLDEEGIDYVVTGETTAREYDAVVSFPVPTNAVEPILDSLKEVGIEEQSYTVVMDAQTVISKRFGDLQQRYATESVDEERISRQELVTRADELTPTFSVYLAMTLISTIVATAGLLLDSPAVVVGSMVIAPLIGPALTASIGTIVNDQELFVTGAYYQVAGVIVGIAGAAVFAWSLQSLFLVPPGVEITQIGEIAERITPELLLLPVALGAGVAGVLSLSTGFSVAIVGVMIAAALVPPIAAAGIAIAWGLPIAAIGSTVLVLVNLLGVNLAGLLTLWYTGYRPGSWLELPSVHRQMLRRIAVLTVAVLLLSAFLGGVTYTEVQVSAFERTAIEETESVIGEQSDLEVISVEAQLRDEGPLGLGRSLDATGQIDVVNIELGGPVQAQDPELVDPIHARINGHTEEDVRVTVRFTTSYER